ncbi:MAG: hybrid sensor histidine kinase/response regulator [Magnetococcales bacterium]|nr:hybrid sensor histidine kinase/response regulator [Magnetococcales bacterium]
MKKRPTILIVDDERFNLNVLLDLLKPDYSIMVATNGEMALQRIHSATQPDLILLDIMMPDMDGYEVCRQIKSSEKTRDIPVIFITAMGDIESEMKGLEIGAVDYITKPISPPIVRARVKTHLNLRTAFQQLEQQNLELIEAEKLKQDVDLMVRHDMKSPLNGVIGFSELILSDAELPVGYRKNLEIIRNCGMKVLHMINLSLGLYRMERGIYQLDAKNIDLMPLIRDVHTDSMTWLRGHRLTVKITMNGQPSQGNDPFFVLGEEMLCYSMLANLIKNAIEASPEGESINISLDSIGVVAKVAIHNQGAVPKEIRPIFFDKYATSGKKSGTGLGTYSARLIAQTLGGSIGMSSCEQAGTEIIVTLPKGDMPNDFKLVQSVETGSNQETDGTLSEYMLVLRQSLEMQDGQRAGSAIDWLQRTTADMGLVRMTNQFIRLMGTVEVEDWQEALQIHHLLEQKLIHP